MRAEPLQNKSDTKEMYLDYIASLERNTGTTVKRVHCDNAKEFLASKPALRKSGINMTTSAPYSPQSSGMAERINTTLMKKVWVLLRKSRFNTRCWGEALLHAEYLHNRLTSPALRFKPPHESMFAEAPDNSSIRTFRYMAYLHQHRPSRSSAFADHKVLVVYLVIRNGLHKAHLRKQYRLVESRHVSFDKGKFPRSRMTDNGVVVRVDDHQNERNTSRNNEALSVNQEESSQRFLADEVTM